MKRLFFLTLLILASLGVANAQKLVIGSEVDGHTEIESLQWLTDAPSAKRVWIIDFFSVKNPTAKKFYDENIAKVAQKMGTDAEIVVVTARSDSDFEALAKRDGGKYHFAVDPKQELHKLLGAEYIPYTAVLSSEGELLWQGNLSTLLKDFEL